MMSKESAYFNFSRLYKQVRLVLLSAFFMSCNAGNDKSNQQSASNQSVDQTETQTNIETLHGSYCAEVTYSNANTGTHSNYSLLVDVKGNQVICIHWPQGGQLDLDHFNPVQISSDSTSQIQTFEGKQYRVKIVGPESACSDRFQGQLHQCKGTTKEGKRCKRMTDNPSGYCYQHEGK